MESFARPPTRLAQIPIARVDTALGPAARPYPSPAHERASFGTAEYPATDMAATSPHGAGPVLAGVHSNSVSPRTVTAPPKTVTFALVKPVRARLPLRVSIYLHDTTDSIITTVKNFYGLYSGPGFSKGLSFEDQNGNILIARYENFTDGMNVNVRVIEEPLGPGFHAALASAQGYYDADGQLPQAPQTDHHHAARPASGASPLRSPSPNGGRGRRSASAGAQTAGAKKGRSRSSKNRTNVNGEAPHDSFNGYSSGDGASGSFSSRNKEHLGNTDISLENIVEGGRRNRAKFESSELPLFAPTQMPAATSNPSISPARRIDPHRQSLPLAPFAQHPFSNPHPLYSPPAHTNGHIGPHVTPGGGHRRGLGSFGQAVGSGVAPGNQMMATPDPTVGSSGMSEEDKDVAMQLILLCGAPPQGRSGMDDAVSCRADAASSSGATSDAGSYSEDEAPAPRRQKLDASGGHKRVFGTTDSRFTGPRDGNEASADDSDSDGAMAAPGKIHKLKANTLPGAAASKPRPQAPHLKTKSSKPSKPKTTKKPPSSAMGGGPMTPASLPASSRKPSVSSNAAFTLTPAIGGVDEEHPDLSTKPRCQRCRKSKKGCDRQRPCGRCRDAGLGAEHCISEDEGNGRKGRYGRHMGVPIKRGGGGGGGGGEGGVVDLDMGMPPPAAPVAGGVLGSAAALLPAAPLAGVDVEALLAAAAPVAGAGGGDKNKKRKR